MEPNGGQLNSTPPPTGAQQQPGRGGGAGGQATLPGTDAPAPPQAPQVAELQAELIEARKALAKFQADARTAEEKAAESRGEFEKLAQSRAAERDAALSQVTEMRKQHALQAEAIRAGLTDFDYLALVNMDLVQVDGTQVTGADKALEDLKSRKPLIFGQGKTHNTPTPSVNPGAGGTPPGGQDPTREYSAEEWAHMAKTMTPQQQREFFAARDQARRFPPHMR